MDVKGGRKRVGARVAPVGALLIAALALVWVLERSEEPALEHALVQGGLDAGSRAFGPSAGDAGSLENAEPLAVALDATSAQQSEHGARPALRAQEVEVEPLWVRVLPARPGAPCSPAVAAAWIDAQGRPKRVEGHCDDAGHVALKRPAGWRVELIVTGELILPARHEVAGSHPTRERALTIQADLLAGVQIRARDILGRPLAGGMLTLEADEAQLREFAHELGIDPLDVRRWIYTRCGTTLDARGEALVQQLLPGIPYRARLETGTSRDSWFEDARNGAKVPALYEKMVVLAPDELRLLECTVASAPLVGRVTDQHGVAVAGCAVQNEGYGGSRALTNSEGLFELCLVPEGETTLHLLPATQSELAARSFQVQVPPLSERKPLDLRTDRGLYLRGQLLGSTGVHARHGYVSAVPVGGGPSISATCGEEGSFVLGPLLAGRYELSGIDYDPRLQRSGLFPIATPIEVKAGDAEIVLRCE